MNTSSILAEKMFILKSGIIPHQNILNLLNRLKNQGYEYDWRSHITVARKGNSSVYLQEARYGSGYRVTGHDEEYHRQYGGYANNIGINEYEEIYITGSGMILYIKGNKDFYVSHLNEIHLGECITGSLTNEGALGEIISPAYKSALEAGFIMKNLRDGGMEWEINKKYKVKAYLDRISRSGNFVINSKIETPGGEVFELQEEILISTQKTERIEKTILYNIKDIVKKFKAFIKEGEDPNVAIKIATSGDSKETKRRVDFTRQNPEMRISVEAAICPSWHNGVGLINKIYLSGYSPKSIAQAIGFIGDPEKPLKYSLEYKTREGANAPWAIEISYSTQDGGGRYWFYLDGASADAHNGNLETLSSLGGFEQYKGLLWIFLNPLKEMLRKG